MKTVISLLLSGFLLLLSAGESNASEPVELHTDRQLVPVEQMSRLLEPHGSITYSEAREAFRRADSDQIAQVNARRENLGYRVQSAWYQFRVRGGYNLDSHWLLHLPFPLLQRVEVFEEDGEGPTLSHTIGASVPFDQRPIASRHIALPLVLSPDVEKTITLHVVSNSNFTVQPQFITAHAMQQLERREMQFLFLYYGAVLSTLIYNLFLFVSIRQQAYAWYVAFGMSFLLAQASLNGMLPELFPFLTPSATATATIAFISAALVGAALFSRSFLRLERGVLLRLVNLSAVAASLMLVGSFIFPYPKVASAINIMLPFEMAILIAAGIVRMRAGYRPARYYVGSWAVLIFGAAVYSLKSLGVFPANAASEYMLQLGSAMEIVLLSFGLADLFHLERTEKEKAQERLGQTLTFLLESTRELALARDLPGAARALARMLRMRLMPQGQTDTEIWMVAEAPLPKETTDDDLHWDTVPQLHDRFGTLETEMVTASGELIVPLHNRSRLIGVLAFPSFCKPHLADEERALIRAMLSSLAISAENIEFTKDIAVKARLEKEIEASAAVQTSLLAQVPQLPGLEIITHYQAAEKAGGDWYGFHHDREGNRLLVFIGDVTGHGVASALVTAMVAGTLRSGASLLTAEKPTIPTPELLLRLAELANDCLRSTAARTEKLMTMAFLGIELQTGTVAYINAAHPPIYHSEAKKARGIAIPGTRLGWSDDASFEVSEITLNPGDLLFLYTDGLLENSGPGGSTFTTALLKSCLQKQSTMESLRQELLKTAHSIWEAQPPEDDVSFVALRWTGEFFSPVQP